MSCAPETMEADNRENGINAFGMDVRRISAFKRHRDVFLLTDPHTISRPVGGPNQTEYPFFADDDAFEKRCAFFKGGAGASKAYSSLGSNFILVVEVKCGADRSPIPVRSRKQYQTRISPGCEGNLALALASRSRLDPRVFLEGEGGSGGWGSAIARARTRAPPSPRARPRVLRVPRAG